MMALTYIGVPWEALPTLIASVYKQYILSLIYRIITQNKFGMWSLKVQDIGTSLLTEVWWDIVMSEC